MTKTNRIKFFLIVVYVINISYNQFSCYAQTWNRASVYNNLNSVQSIVWQNKLTVSKYDNVSNGEHLCFYDGGVWDTTKSIIESGYIESFCEYNNELYIGGHFPRVNNISGTNDIARWDGAQWKSVGVGGDGYGVYCMAIYKGELYAGGGFISMGGKSVNRIARWDGTQWKDVGGGVTNSIPTVHAMAVYHDKLYVGGTFYKAGAVNAANIARWDGAKWDSVGSNGVDGIVNTMYVDTVKDVLYAGGGFYSAGGEPNTYAFAQWNDTVWSGLDTNKIWGGVYAITKYNNDLYIGGGFQSVGSNSNAYTIAKWDGTNWYALNGGHPNFEVMALKEYNGNLYVGGLFTSIAGNNKIQKLACYGNTCPQNVGIESLKLESLIFNVYPNPGSKQVTIKLNSPEVNAKYVLQLIDVQGKEVYKTEMQNEKVIDVSKYSKGIYSVLLIDKDGKSITQKLIVE